MRTRLAVAAATGLVLVAAACQPAGPFTATADMHAPRAGHTATLLPSGRVIVAGGAAAGQPSVERYDPASGRWLVRAEMLTPRHGHRATRLSSGKVLITGGRSTATGTLLTAAEIYDAANDRWIRAAGTPYAGGHSAALLPNGKVLAVFADDRGRGWLYDPVADAWSPSGPKRTVAWRTTTVLPGGDALVVGGDTVPATDRVYGASRAERFDPGTGQWALTGTAPDVGVRLTTTLGTGTVMAIGPVVRPIGSYVEPFVGGVTYDHDAGTWRKVSFGPCDDPPGAGLTITGLAQQALVVGRAYCPGNFGNSDPVAVLIAPDQQEARLEGVAERQDHAAVRLADGRVLVTGGTFGHWDGSSGQDCCHFEVRATAELYTP